jgi:NAD(P)H-hydrate repair Nnr-like enzyme with NAD(P)H-hydrate epimerase domain
MGRKKLKPLSRQDPKVLGKIAKELEKGADPKRFDALIDSILGTGFEEDSLEERQAWEQYRKGFSRDD